MKSVLIVDDNLVNLKQISAQLEDKYDVSLAKSGELALKICGKEKPDIILLDVEMPGMDGFQTIAALKNIPGFNQIPVIFLTSRDDPATEIKCLESGAVDFLTKPANTDILYHRLNLHLEFSAYQFKLENTIKELEDNIGTFFAELVECKDYNVAVHVLRTGVLAEILAAKLFETGIFKDELKAQDIGMIRRAASFYDIGKIGISDIFLCKEGPLTEEEYREVQKHTIIGGQLLEQIYKRTPTEDYLKLAITIAVGHHERYDGKGYPHGLKGEEIPLVCRIISVANAYDTCVTDRVYRKKMTHEQACQAIVDSKGIKFDPRIVEVFCGLKDQFAEVCASSSFSSHNSKWSVYHAANSNN